MINDYARVSTHGQSVDAPVRQLTKAGCKEVIREVASGAKTDRAQLRKALDVLEPCDVLMVTRLDRLARSTRDLSNTFNTITDEKAVYGRLMLTVLAGLAEFEGELIHVRTGDGRARAVARGVTLGPKAKITPHQQREASHCRDYGDETLREIARNYNLSHSTIQRLAP
jgi:DNA invertase Pin-like site-specific DNA recombinase